MTQSTDVSSIDALCAMLQDKETRESAQKELSARGTKAVLPLLKIRLAPDELYATDEDHMMAMLAIDDILIDQGRKALPIIEKYINGLEEPQPLDSKPTRDGYTVPTYMHAINVTSDIIDEIRERPGSVQQKNTEGRNKAYCAVLLRITQTGLMPSFFPKREAVVFPDQCPVCNATNDLHEIKPAVVESYHTLKFDQKPRYCRAHTTSYKLQSIILTVSALLGLIFGFISITQNWLVIGPIGVSLVVWPIAFSILGWLILRIVSWALSIEDLSHKSTAPVEVVEISSDSYVMAFHNGTYFDRFIELNSGDVIENLGEIEVNKSVSIEKV